MLRIYLDTNIYIVGILYPDSPPSIILRKISDEGITVVQSDYLFDEVLNFFRRSRGKEVVGKVREFLLTVPNNEIVDKYTWSMYMDRYRDLVADIDDIPHICSYFAGECDHFVTLNRRLTRMKIEKIVSFCDPDEFLLCLEERSKE